MLLDWITCFSSKDDRAKRGDPPLEPEEDAPAEEPETPEVTPQP
jgi:hypothetical protein